MQPDELWATSQDILVCAAHVEHHQMVISLLFAAFFMCLALVCMINPIGEPE
jgi:hypothetical protein